MVSHDFMEVGFGTISAGPEAAAEEAGQSEKRERGYKSAEGN